MSDNNMPAPRETVKAEGLRDEWLAHLVSRWLLDVRSGHYEPDEQTAKGIIDEVRDYDAKALAAQAVRPAPEALREQDEVWVRAKVTRVFQNDVEVGLNWLAVNKSSYYAVVKKSDVRALRLGSQPAGKTE